MTNGGPSTSTLAGREVGRIGYGAMQLESAADAAEAAELLRTAAALGVDHVDTAHFYTGVNDVLSAARLDALVATKVGAERDGEGRLVAAQRPEQLRAQVDANLRTLGAERLDLVYLRRLDAPPGIVAAGDQRVDVDDQLATLLALRDAGTIGAVGLSNVDAATVERTSGAGIAAVQNAFGLLDRAAEPVRRACAAHGIAFVPFFPLGGGFPANPKVVEDPRVIAVARRLGATPAQVGLAWLLRDPGTLLIPGTRSTTHLRENLAAADLVLDDDALAALEA